MKIRNTIIVGLSLFAASLSLHASDIEIKNVKFDKVGLLSTPSISGEVANNTNKHVIAWRGSLVCHDAFGDKVINQSVVSRSADIAPGASKESAWTLNIFGDEGGIVSNNDSRFFACYLTNIDVVFDFPLIKSVTNDPPSLSKTQNLKQQYVVAINDHVVKSWKRPPTTKVGMNCTVKVFQIPGGEVVNTEVVSPCNADQATRRSIKNAVTYSGPLPYTGYENVFEREIILNFNHN